MFTGPISNIPTMRRGRRYYIGDKSKGSDVKKFLIVAGIFLVIAMVFSECFLVYMMDILTELKKEVKEVDMITGEVIGGLRLSSRWSIYSLLSGLFGLVFTNKSQSKTSSAHPAVSFRGEIIQSSVFEPNFNFEIADSIALNRVTEYCQWQEHSNDKCETCYRDVESTGKDGKTEVERESYQCNCVREYYYIKSWQPYRINSFLFDQPAAHYNPQRDPFPSTSIYSEQALIGKIQATHAFLSNVKAASRPLSWSRNSIRPPQGFFASLFGWKDSTRYEDVSSMLSRFSASYAAIKEHFVYAGNGYFYSPHEPSVTERLLKAAGQYMEGSLLDFQIGDFIPSCTAGDIKLSYKVVDPDIVSGIGGMVWGDSVHSHKLDTYTTSKGSKYSVLYSGVHDSKSMIESEMWQTKRYVYIIRVLYYIMACVFSNLLAAYYGVDYCAGDRMIFITSTSSIYLITVYGIKAMALLYYNELTNSFDGHITLLFITVAIVGFTHVISFLSSISKLDPDESRKGWTGIFYFWQHASIPSLFFTHLLTEIHVPSPEPESVDEMRTGNKSCHVESVQGVAFAQASAVDVPLAEVRIEKS